MTPQQELAISIYNSTYNKGRYDSEPAAQFVFPDGSARELTLGEYHYGIVNAVAALSPEGTAVKFTITPEPFSIQRVEVDGKLTWVTLHPEEFAGLGDLYAKRRVQRERRQAMERAGSGCSASLQARVRIRQAA